MRVAVWEAIVGRDALVAKPALLKPSALLAWRNSRSGAVEVRPEILLEVPERERRGRDPTIHLRPAGGAWASSVGLALR